MRSSHSLTLSALVLSSAFALTGCSATPAETDSSPTSSTASTAPVEAAPSEPAAPALPPAIDAVPASGAVIAGSGYTYSVPADWAQGDTAGVPGADTIANSTPASGVNANVNVKLNPAGARTPDDIEANVGAELAASGATDVVVLDRVTVSGSETVHVTASRHYNGSSYRSIQYSITHGDQTYDVTFSSDYTLLDADATAIAESVLASWTWL
jgi:hypothetical protein